MGDFLTASQIQDFNQNGILVVENFLSEKQVLTLRKEILKLVDEIGKRRNHYKNWIQMVKILNRFKRFCFDQLNE